MATALPVEVVDGEAHESEDQHQPDNYGLKAYWNESYSGDAYGHLYDWYQDFRSLQPFIQPHIRLKHSVLIAGCGNSPFSADMHRQGFQKITNIDFSETVIEKMKAEFHDLPMQWLCMDALNMTFPKHSFDACIDKGMLDAIMCGENSYDNAAHVAQQMYGADNTDRMRFVDGTTAPLPERPEGAVGCDMNGEDPRDPSILSWDESWKSRRWFATVQELHFYDAIHKKIGKHFVYILRKRPYRPLPDTSAVAQSEEPA